MAGKRFKSTKPIDKLVASAANMIRYDRAADVPPGKTAPEQITHRWTKGMARHFREAFGKKLAAVRKHAGLSLNELARQAGVDHSQLVRLESGERTCTLETA